MAKIHNSVMQLLRDLPRKNPSFWERRGVRVVNKLLKEALKVPAYQAFLKDMGVSSQRPSFNVVPLTSKEAYLRAYSYEDLFIPKTLTELPRVYAVTSGSTGKPFYFPRQEVQDRQYQLIAELYLRTNFSIHTKSTLYINAFPMGPWIGGVFTYEVITRIAREGKYPLSIITTGIDIDSVIRAVKELGPRYDQIILGAYGPFAKEILDRGIKEGVDWKQLSMQYIFSAEAFPESFRDYVCTISDTDQYRGTLNHYGTVDLGTMSYETPLCILIRKLALLHPNLYKKLFGSSLQIPTLTQYIPELYYFESIDGNLCCTSESAIPLIRYSLGDTGGVYSFNEMLSMCTEAGVDIYAQAKMVGIEDTIWKLPFVFVRERSDFSVSYYAFQVYPGPLRNALLDPSLHHVVTGKCTLTSTYAQESQDPKLVIYVELSEGVEADQSILKEVEERLHTCLLETHSEYKETIRHMGEKARVTIELCTYGDPRYFKSGGKQQWVR